MTTNFRTQWATDRGLTLSKAHARCLHGVIGAKCPGYPLRCPGFSTKAVFDHYFMMRRGNTRVLLTEPYWQGEDSMREVERAAYIFGVEFVVGEPGTGPWATHPEVGRRDQQLVPVAFSHSLDLAYAALLKVTA